MRKFVGGFLNEVYSYGGFPLSYGNIARDLQEKRFSQKERDAYLMGLTRKEPLQGVEPLSYQDFKSRMAEIESQKAKPAIPDVKPSPPISYRGFASLRQTARGKAQDKRQQHSIVVKPNSPRVKSWLRDPGTADIKGIDTPRARISRRTPRISPRVGKLR